MSEELKQPVSQEIVPVNPPAHQLPDVWSDSGVLATSFPTDTPQSRYQFTRFANQIAAPLLGERGKTLSLVGYILEVRQRENDDTGEIEEYKYVKLCCEDGKCYEAPGVTARRCMGRIAWGMPASPWTPPLKVKVDVIQRPNGHSLYSIVPLEPEQPATKGRAAR